MLGGLVWRLTESSSKSDTGVKDKNIFEEGRRESVDKDDARPYQSSA